MIESSENLTELAHHRWNIPILALLYQSGGSKFITIVNKLNLSRDSLSRTLTALIDTGWLMHNPGYGHPMRPEYILTPAGESLGPACVDLVRWLKNDAEADAAFRKWSLLVIACLCERPQRFSQLKRQLPDVTPRALTSTLKVLESVNWMEPVSIAAGKRPGYGLTGRGKQLCPLIQTLVEVLQE